METRHYIVEKYMVLTNLTPREAFDKHGFWLDPAETRFIDGVKHYRVIYPRQIKGGWSNSYDNVCKMDADTRVDSIDHTKGADKK